MKLLILTNNPSRPSFRQRIEIYLPILRDAGIDCTIAKLPMGKLARFGLFRQAASFDCIFLHKKCLNFFDALSLRKYSKKIIYDFDDAIMYSPNRPSTERTSHFRLFRRTAKLADLVIAGNNYLARHARKLNENVKILPTGLNIKEYRVQREQKNDSKIRLVWIGSKSTLKYLAEIKPALEEIGSRFDNVVLRIIADRFFDLQNMTVEKRPWSLENQAKDLTTADIGLAPLPDNRFTKGKCGFKILQYQAAHLSVITSPVGVNAEYVVDGVTGCLASDNDQWVDRISELTENAKLRKQMADAGRRHVERFDIGAIGTKLSEILTEFIEKTEPVAVPVTPPITSKPKVSVCIPTYNRKNYLKETIDSILAQTYKDYEIVIVDDGSTDGTEEMIRQLDFLVTYYWQENAGDAAARNKLIELAKGDYISFIDSDDLLMPDALERMVHAIQAQTEDVVVYGSYYRIDQAGNTCGKCKRKFHSGNITKHLFQTIFVHFCGSMISKRILRVFSFDTSLKVCSDYDLWLRLSTRYPFKALPEPTFKRRRHLGNLSDPSFENCLTEFQVLKRFYYDKGGREVLPERLAMRRLSQQLYRVGKCALAEGDIETAKEYFKKSCEKHMNLKSTAKRLSLAFK